MSADALHEKYAKCIDIVKNAHSSTAVLMVVDEMTTDLLLMISLLCLSDVAAVPAGESATAVQVATRDQLEQVRGPVDIVVNVDMVPSIVDLAAGVKLLKTEGSWSSP